MAEQIDAQVDKQGTIVAITPLTPAARQWIDANCKTESWQWVGDMLASDFEDGTTQGWFARGSATVAPSSEQAHSGTGSLLTNGRTATWQGPGYDMLGILQAGATYAIEAYVRLVEGSDPVTMTMQRRPSGGDDSFDTIAWQVPASANEWVRVAGSYSFATAANEVLQLPWGRANLLGHRGLTDLCHVHPPAILAAEEAAKPMPARRPPALRGGQLGCAGLACCPARCPA